MYNNFPNAKRASDDFSPDKMIVVLCKDGGFAERPPEKGSIIFFLVRMQKFLSYSVVKYSSFASTDELKSGKMLTTF